MAGWRGFLPAQQQDQRRSSDMGLAVSQSPPYSCYSARSTVSLVKGENRRKCVRDVLLAIDDQILTVLKAEKFVVRKPNCNSVIALGTTDPEALWAWRATAPMLELRRRVESRSSRPNYRKLWSRRK